MLAANYFIKIMALLFIGLLDKIAYLLLAVAYIIFLAVSQLDLFSSETAGDVYNEISARFYSALSVIMIFVFAYFLIMMIIDPDGGQKKASTQMVKDVVFSIVLVIVLPTVFGYMSLFQKHILTNNTIGALILGGTGTTDDNPGKQISMIVFSAFFHPQGTMYANYFDNDGNFIGKDQAITVCKGPHINGDGVEASTDDDVCTAWAEGLEAWNNDDSIGVGAVTSRAKLRDTVGDEGGMEYLWILSTVAAIAVAYFFFSYTLDVGTRAVKLGFLQIIAPIPVMLKMFPQTKKTFDSWFAEIKKCYLEIFARVAVIFFIVKLCTMVPAFIGVLFKSTSGVEGNFLIKAIATVCLILGLLKFAKEAPGLFKTIFGGSTGLFAGLDFKPGVKRRISENEYAMKAGSTAIGALGGAIGSYQMARRNYLKNSDVQGDDFQNAMLSRLHGVGAGLRGIVSGGKKGFENTPQEFSAKNVGAAFNQGASSGQSAYVQHENKKVFNFQQAGKAADANGTTMRQELFKQGLENGAKPFFENLKDAITTESDLITGVTVNGSAATDTINKATKYLGDMIGWTKGDTEAIKTAKSEIEKTVLSEGKMTRGDQVITINGGEDVGFDQKAYEEACRRAGATSSFSMKSYEEECKMAKVKAKDDATGYYYNPATKAYDAAFKPEDYVKSRATEKFNTKTGKYEKGYNPEKDYRKHAISLADAKKQFTDMENQEIAKSLNDKYKSGRATMMATLREQMAKEIGNLGNETIADLEAAIHKNAGTTESVDAFLKRLSDKTGTISEGDVAALKKVKSTLEQQGKNLSIQAQLQQQAKQNGAGNGGQPPKDKPKS